ncbi:MAG: YbdD/YjiX family protein [Gemmatimonadales bacterium]
MPATMIGFSRRWPARLSVGMTRLVHALRTIVGAPDYERYRNHVIACHPTATPMTREQFTRERLSRRYDQPGSRCC